MPCSDSGVQTFLRAARWWTRPRLVSVGEALWHRSGMALGAEGRGWSGVEALEPRQLLATFSVQNVNDVGAGSLREAIADANNLPGADVITFDVGARGTIALSGSELAVTGEVTIDGPGASELQISGSNALRVFHVAPGAVVSISGLTIRNGYSFDVGGGVFNEGTLAINNCTISGNWAQNAGGVQNNGTLSISNSDISGNTTQYAGGGLRNSGTAAITDSSITGNSAQDISYSSGGGIDNTGTLTITNSTISGNSSIENGGGINASGGSLTISGSTISGNSAWYGGGIFSSRSLAITNSTISGNTSQPGGQGGGLFTNTLQPVTIRNSTIAGNLGNGGIHITDGSPVMVSCIVAGNTGGDILGGPVGAGSTNNLIQDAAHAGGLTNNVNENLVGADPLLSPLANNGGPTKTMASQAGSPALGKGLNPNNLTTDQRGGLFARGSSVDIGAYQRQALALVVDTTSDVVDGNSSAGNLSLREAIDFCNANPLADGITFASAMIWTTITLGGSELLVFGELTIAGPAYNALSISGNNATRVFEIASSASVTISDLTIKDGNGPSLAGGVYVNPNATLTLAGVAVSGNTATYGSGGVQNDGTLTITNSIISGNSAQNSHGGGINNSGMLTITNSTISGNWAQADHGGGINNNGTLTITSSTISGNTAQGYYSGGGVNNFGTLTITGSAISGNSALYGAGVNNSGGTFTITSTTINSNSAAGGSGAGVHNYYGNATGAITNCVISNNTATSGAGVANSSSSLIISGSTISGNAAAAEGGGIYNDASLTITNTSISGNTAITSGGGVYNPSGTLSVSNSTISGNSASTQGGGIGIASGSLDIINSTISGNTAGNQGGGVFVSNASAIIRNSTIAANLGAGGIHVDQAFPLLISCLISGNTGGDIDNGTLALGSINNLVQDAAHAGGLSNNVDGNLVGVDPLLGALADNGGKTKTIALQGGSPALAKGLNPANLTTDQRGGPFVRGTSIDIGAYQRQSFAFVVDTAVDESDGDYGAGDLSLREAIEAAGPNPGNDTITFARALNGQTITLGGTELLIKGDVTITGPGASLLSISGNNTSRVVNIAEGATVAISGLTIIAGKDGVYGGAGIFNSGTLTITNAVVSGNNSLHRNGAGLYNSGVLSITASTISGNTSSSAGAGIFSEGTLTIANCTISDNYSELGGGGVFNTFGTLTVTNSTISENTTKYTGGAGVHNAFGTLTVTNSTISGNTGSDAVLAYGASTIAIRNTTIAANLGTGGLYITNGAAPVLVSCIVAGNAGGDIRNGSLGAGSTNNLIQDASHAGGLTNNVNGNLVGVDPKLSPLADNGGATKTMALASGSPALAKGLNPANLTTDQRGGLFARGASVDIGAYQRQSFAFVVNTAVDESDGNFGAGDLSLREAIEAAGPNPGNDTITFAAALNGQTITLGGTELLVKGDVTITGPGASLLSISGNNASSVFEIASGANVSIIALTIKNGNAAGIGGGGFYNHGGTLSISNSIISGSTGYSGGGVLSTGTLTITGSTISGNAATYGGGVNTSGTTTISDSVIEENSSLGGGGVSSGGTLTISNSTISGNEGEWGGGVRNTFGTLTISNSTISGNSAPTSGGGVYSYGGLTTIRNSTIAANLGSGGIFVESGAPVLISCIVAGNVGGDILGKAVGASSTNNLVQDATHAGGLTNNVNANMVGVDPLLSSLSDNGGPTKTISLWTGSPAINKGLNPANLSGDQRGLPRVRGTAIDIGAFEFSAIPTLASLSVSANSVVRGQSVTLTASGAADLDGAISRVDFYRDANNNGVADSGELVGSDSNPAGGYTFSLNTSSLPLGSQTFLARAVDNDAGVSTPKSAAATMTNAVPTVASLTTPGAVFVVGQTLVLTAGGVADVDGTIARVDFYRDANANGVADAGELVGSDSNPAGGYTYTLTSTQSGVVPIGSVKFLAIAVDNNGAASAPRQGSATAQSPADHFIEVYTAAPKAADGLVDGDWIADNLKSTVSNVATSDAYWGARNHWFQVANGDVWVLWQGGDVHLSKTLAGQHEWVLTNLTDAAGLSGNMRFAPGSLSGITTGWNAFNVQGIQDGKLMALWWSPEGSAGQYFDTDGSIKQGKAWGLRGNGWSLSSISDAIMPINGAVATPPASFRAYTVSQGNSRTSFDPRADWFTANSGMSVVLVDTTDHVYLASFNVWQDTFVDGARNDLNYKWVIERLADVPSFKRFGIESQEPAFEQEFIAAANQ
ncbi:MAG: right-handed parallel beta-helix repeat-containing protein [Phycisphaerae bacterium]|nr:right-handed parallel beta-helix repeat-containing protein [Phycisphaerae bacterium]